MSVGMYPHPPLSFSFSVPSYMDPPIPAETIQMLQIFGGWIEDVENTRSNEERLQAIENIPPLSASVNYSLSFAKPTWDADFSTRMQNCFIHLAIKDFKKMITWMEGQIKPICEYSGDLDADMKNLLRSRATSFYFLFLILQNSLKSKLLLDDEELGPRFISLSNQFNLLFPRELILK